MYKKILTCTAVILCMAALLCSCSGNSKKNYSAPVNISFDAASAEDVEKVLNKKPDSTENNEESGITANNYENYNFAGYDGKLVFYYAEDKLMYYQWVMTEADEKKATQIYKDVCDNLQHNYGDGTESNNAASNMYTTSYETEEEQVIAQKVLVDNSYQISFMVVGK